MDKNDERWMRRALRLAERGLTPPNPMVGCVITRGVSAVGEGFHPKAGEPHAEIFALRAAGEAARGATVYVTLEPCSHHGRTPPCADALIAAGVARVVVAAKDPNPKVAGQGIERLRGAGIEVEVGVLEAQAKCLNEAFFQFHRTGKPLITLKAAMTLDGKIATRTRDSKWITGEAARRHVHKLRARSGAAMTGVGTVLADDPRLTARVGERDASRQPLRVVVDSRLRTPPDATIVRIAGPIAPLLIAAVQGDGDAELVRRAELLRAAGAEVAFLPAVNERVDLNALIRLLAEREVISVLVEGGGTLNAALLEARLADRALFFIAPKLIGGRDAPTPIEGIGVDRMEQAFRIEGATTRRYGPDLAIEGAIVYPPADPNESGG